MSRVSRVLFLLALVALSLGERSVARADRTVCASGCDHTTIQAAIDAAVAGDVIKIRANETFTLSTPLLLRNKGALASPITIRTDALDANLPAAGYRVTVGQTINGVATTDYRPFLPDITMTAAQNYVNVEAGAQDYILLGLEFVTSTPSGSSQAMVSLGVNSTTQQFEADQPQDIVVDRSVFMGHRLYGQKVGIDLNGKNLSVLNSHFDEIKGAGQDAIAVRCVNGTGPLTIVNNYISAAAQGFLCGGDDPQMRTFAEVAAGATTTQATLQTFRAGHTIATLKVGQFIAVLAGGGTQRHHTYVRSINAGTNTITYDAIASAPDTGAGSDIRWGAIPDDITFRRNHVTKRTAWQDPIYQTVGTVTPTALAGGGSLTAGTYYYRVQGYLANGYANAKNYGPASAQVSATVAANGRVQLSWAEIPDVSHYRIGGRASGTQTSNTAGNVFADVTAAACTNGTCTFIDTGANMAAPANACGAGGSLTNVANCASHTWIVKNLFEIKYGTHYQIDSNIFEHSWTGADSGYGIWLKSNNTGGNAEFAQTKDVVFEENIVRDVPGCFNILGRINASGAERSGFIENLTIRDVLCYNSTSDQLQGKATTYALKVQAPTKNLKIQHSTWIHHMRGFLYLTAGATGDTNTDLEVTNNLARRETYGIFGPSCVQGTECLDEQSNGYTYCGNALAGASQSTYPDCSNVFPSVSEFETQHFTSYGSGVSGTYSLLDTSTWNDTATDGLDRGANIAAIATAVTGVLEGTPETGGQPLGITTLGLTDATEDVAYTATVTATGGTPAYTWSNNGAGTTLNDADAECAGLSVSAAGVVSGTPTVTGVCSWTARVADSASGVDTQALTVTVNAAAASLAITTTTLSNGVVGTPYTTTLAATGGTLPRTWEVASGTLPPGMTLYPIGVFAGVPTGTGTSNFTVRATDSDGLTDTQALSMTVALETLPCNRNRADSGQEARLWRRPTAPPSECVLTGDPWVDTSTTPPKLKIAVTAGETPTWEIQSASTIFTLLGTPGGGDIIVGNEDGEWIRMQPGPGGTFLQSAGDSLTWAASAPRVALPFHVPVTASSNWTQPQAETELLGTSSKRMLLDTTPYSSVRLAMRVQGGSTSANSPQCYLRYSLDESTWTTVPGTALSVSTQGTRASTWTAVPDAAKTDTTIWVVSCSGGDGVTSSFAVGNTSAQFR